jgi:hypothetical protein
VIRNAEEALFLLKRSGVMSVVRAGACPSLVVETLGEGVRGSWWAHPRGRLVYAILTALDDHPDVLVTRLIDGKNALVHRTLWPALLRLVTDEGWRARASASLEPNARALLRRVESEGRVRGDALAPGASRARESLARSVLVRVDQEHTPSGRHQLVLESWSGWARSHNVAAADVSFEEALAQLESACGKGTLPFGEISSRKRRPRRSAAKR